MSDLVASGDQVRLRAPPPDGSGLIPFPGLIVALRQSGTAPPSGRDAVLHLRHGRHQRP
ncbi:hypothetical protein [Streptomyces sp. NPDC057094]|uniref:hypothetical protein n=1 Tax=Streptomyces sp. NPDC057094 TaxID=3346018 RepID=UPI003630211E